MLDPYCFPGLEHPGISAVAEAYIQGLARNLAFFISKSGMQVGLGNSLEFLLEQDGTVRDSARNLFMLGIDVEWSIHTIPVFALLHWSSALVSHFFKRYI
jgi:hypothetical protein